MAMATVAGWSVGDTHAGNSTLPWGELSLTTSLREMPSFADVSAGTSTQPPHASCVMVSGASCFFFQAEDGIRYRSRAFLLNRSSDLKHLAHNLGIPAEPLFR